MPSPSRGAQVLRARRLRSRASRSEWYTPHASPLQQPGARVDSQYSPRMRIHDREPPRIALANQPTRGHWMRYGAQIGTRFWLKRDDQTGSELMGNKVRKL